MSKQGHRPKVIFTNASDYEDTGSFMEDGGGDTDPEIARRALLAEYKKRMAAKKTLKNASKSQDQTAKKKIKERKPKAKVAANDVGFKRTFASKGVFQALGLPVPSVIWDTHVVNRESEQLARSRTSLRDSIISGDLDTDDEELIDFIYGPKLESNKSTWDVDDISTTTSSDEEDDEDDSWDGDDEIEEASFSKEFEFDDDSDLKPNNDLPDPSSTAATKDDYDDENENVMIE